METIRITQRQADRGIAAVLNRVAFGNTVAIVTRFSRPACVILPVAEYERLAGGLVQTSARTQPTAAELQDLARAIARSDP